MFLRFIITTSERPSFLGLAEAEDLRPKIELSNSVILAVKVYQPQLLSARAILVGLAPCAEANAPTGRDHLRAHFACHGRAQRGVPEISLFDRLFSDFAFVHSQTLRQVGARAIYDLLFTG